MSKIDKRYIDPKLVSGFRDYLPENMIPRQWMLDTIRSVFERFGFLPLDTPGIEREEVLLGGNENSKKQIYRAVPRGKSESGLALRFDLTVPLARVVSLYPSKINRPFKRYQMGKVWRGEKPQAGRFNEFMQFDADIVGSNKTSADAEIISIMYEVLTAVGVSDFIIRINNRKILTGLAVFAGYPVDKTDFVLRIIDKLDKAGWDLVSAELAENTDVKLNSDQISKIKQFLDLRNGNNDEVLTDVVELMGISADVIQGANELSEIIKFIEALGVPRSVWQIDFSVARGLDYYTGPVFETTLLKLPGIGSVFSGGRYDDLVSRFGKEDIPATGASVGVDRLFAALEALNLVPNKKTTTKIVVLNFDNECEVYCNTIVGMLRNSGIASELYLGKESNIKSQLAYALKQDVPIIIIAGSRERDSNSVQVKVTRTRENLQISLADLIDTIKPLIT